MFFGVCFFLYLIKLSAGKGFVHFHNLKCFIFPPFGYPETLLSWIRCEVYA